MNLALIHGPNFNLLGTREPEKYGTTTLAQLEQNLKELASSQQAELVCKQSNHEGELLDFIHSLKGNTDFIIINAGAFTHTSVALRDALLAVAIPFIEIHISNTYQREEFRHVSYLSDIAKGVIMGLGVKGYELALSYALEVGAARERLA